MTMSSEWIAELIGRIETEAPDSFSQALHNSLRDSVNAAHHVRPPSAVQILEAHEVPIDALLYFEILLKKNDAAQFLISLGYDPGELVIKRKLLRRGRYFEKYGRQLLTHKNTNIYTYAELIDIIQRPLIQEQFEVAVDQLKLK